MTAVKEKVLQAGKVTLNIDCHELWVGNKEINVTRREWGCLQFLLESHGRMITRSAFLDSVWGPGLNVNTRTIDQHISRIRKKLGSAGAMIKTVPGFGYRLKAA